MVIGFAIIVMLPVKLWLLLSPQSSKLFCLLGSRNPLEITGYALAISACIELAYMLYTEGPDEAVEPLILGFASAALIVSASGSVASFRGAVILVVLVAGISVLFWVKKKYVKVQNKYIIVQKNYVRVQKIGIEKRD
jgi:hypothetical protein